MSGGEGQTTAGPGVVPDGPAYDRSGTHGTGNEPLRQTDGKVTTSFPKVDETRQRDKGTPGREEQGWTQRGYGVAFADPGGAVDDATVSADGRRRVKHIDG